jgi:hypothetical protein
MREIDDAQEDFDREHRYAQAALYLKRIAVPAGMVRRYYQDAEAPDDTTYDIVWIDRLTGRVVIRYDGADPADTNSYYGAPSEEERFHRRGLDPYELIDEAKAKEHTS